jgi:phenylacetate-CoA ligase
MAWLAREQLLNAFQMDTSRMDLYLETLYRGSARHLMAYVDAACMLARHGRQSGGALPQLSSIMACAGTLTDDDRALLGESFDATVHNKYGSRECTDMACECAQGGFHVYAHHVCLEVVDDAGQPVPEGESGHLLVTLLGNHSFPLIRYRIGDVGRLSTSPCDCGRPFPLLQRVEGRSADFLNATDGTRISPAYVCHLLGVVHNPGTIRRFQLVQTGSDCFQLRLEVEPGRQISEIEDAVVKDLRVVLGQDAIIEVHEVDRIEPTASGKYRYTVNELAQNL